MRQKLALAAAAIVFAAAGVLAYQWRAGAFDSGPDPVAAGQRILTARLNGVDGAAQSLEQWRGKVLVVNFWATWCAPCVKEMPSLDRLQARIGKDKLVVIPLSLDGPTRPKVAPFYADKKLTSLGIWFDRSRKVMQALDVSILPTTILVDAKGRELGRLEGEADWDKPEAAALVSGALAG